MVIRPMDYARDLPVIVPWLSRDPTLLRGIETARPDLSKRAYSFVVEHGGRIVGGVDLFNVSPDATRAEIGVYVLDPADRRRGYAMIAGRRFLQHVFGNTTIRTVLAKVANDNEPMLELMPRIGFTRVGERGGVTGWRIDKETFLRKWGDRHGVFGTGTPVHHGRGDGREPRIAG